MMNPEAVEQAALRRVQANADAEAKENGITVHRSTVDPRLRQLDRTIHAFWWEYHKRHLNRLELVSPTERAFTVARDHTLRDINDGYYALRRAVFALFGQEAPDEDDDRKARQKGKAKEKAS